MALSDIACRTAKARGALYKVSDGGGLQLWVQPNGAKLWRFAYRFGGKQKLLAIGAYPVISLADARQVRDDAKRTLALGGDPSQVKRGILCRNKKQAVQGQHSLREAIALSQSRKKLLQRFDLRSFPVGIPIIQCFGATTI